MVFTHPLWNTKHLYTLVLLHLQMCNAVSRQMEKCKIQAFKDLEITQSGKHFDLSGMEELYMISSFMIYAADLVLG